MLRYLHRKTVFPERGALRYRGEPTEPGGQTSTASETFGECQASIQHASGNTPRCEKCNNLEFEFLYMQVADLVNPSSGCFACSMLSTVLHPWLGMAPPLNEIHLAVVDFGLAIYGYREQGEHLDLVLQSLEGFPSPWTSIPERCMTRGVTGPDLAAHTIARWLEACDSSHACVDDTLTVPLPRRVLEVRSSNSVRLLVTDPNVTGLYVCLSHCWGGSVPLQLTSSNFIEFQSEIPWHTLPLTFQHAIAITYKLGLRYLWIDSLCIRQDNLEDWREEGSKMAAIYSGARLTLAASASADSTRGLFRPDPLGPNAANGLRQTHHLTGPGKLPYQVLVRPRADFYALQERLLPLQNRAWFFQEWILSPRVVHFTEALLCWECNDIEQTEDGSVPNEPLNLPRGKKNTLISSNRRQPLSSVTLSLRDSESMVWHSLISMYSGLYLTIRSDILPALQGITTRMAAERQCNFYAGLWDNSLMIDLLWHLLEPSEALEYRAPSWSWASRSGYVSWRSWRWLSPDLIPIQSVLIPEASVVSIKTILVGKNPFGQVSGGEIVLKGLCLPVVFGPRRILESYLIPTLKIEGVGEYDPDFISGSWFPDNQQDPKPEADILMMLMGLWPIHERLKISEVLKIVYESWFLVFERASNVGDIYRRIGIFRTDRLAFRARFLRHAIEQELTII